MSKQSSAEFINLLNPENHREPLDCTGNAFCMPPTTLNKLFKSKNPVEISSVYLLHKYNLGFYTKPSTITSLAKQLKMSEVKVMKAIKKLVRLGILDENEVPCEKI